MKLIQHIGLIHAHEANFTITCGLNDCKSTFTKYESFRRHVYRRHRDRVLCKCNDCDGDGGGVVASEDSDEPGTDTVTGNPPSVDELLLNFRENLFSFILKCREKNHLPVSVQKDIVDDVNFLLCFFKENYDAFIVYHLQKSGFDISKSPELKRILQSNDFFDEASKAIQSPYMIKEHCKSNLNMIEPVHYKLKG